MWKEKFLLRIDMKPVQINLGPNVGDITIGCKPAYLGRVNVISSSRVLKPKEEDKGPRPVVGLRPVAVNRLGM